MKLTLHWYSIITEKLIQSSFWAYFSIVFIVMAKSFGCVSSASVNETRLLHVRNKQMMQFIFLLITYARGISFSPRPRWNVNRKLSSRRYEFSWRQCDTERRCREIQRMVELSLWNVIDDAFTQTFKPLWENIRQGCSRNRLSLGKIWYSNVIYKEKNDSVLETKRVMTLRLIYSEPGGFGREIFKSLRPWFESEQAVATPAALPNGKSCKFHLESQRYPSIYRLVLCVWCPCVWVCQCVRTRRDLSELKWIQYPNDYGTLLMK